MVRIYALFIGYFIGCISMGYIVSRATKTDLRQHGSGNLGTTNALRVLGFRIGLITFLGDVFKGVAAYMIARMLFPEFALMAGLYAGVGTVLGHDFPFYLKFKGGKGVASTLGLILATGFTITPWMMVITFVCGILAVRLTGFISVGSITVSLLMPICAFFFVLPLEGVLLLSALAILTIVKHKENIKRLLAGEENKFTLRKNVKV